MRQITKVSGAPAIVVKKNTINFLNSQKTHKNKTPTKKHSDFEIQQKNTLEEVQRIEKNYQMKERIQKEQIQEARISPLLSMKA